MCELLLAFGTDVVFVLALPGTAWNTRQANTEDTEGYSSKTSIDVSKDTLQNENRCVYLHGHARVIFADLGPGYSLTVGTVDFSWHGAELVKRSHHACTLVLDCTLFLVLLSILCIVCRWPRRTISFDLQTQRLLMIYGC